MARTKSTGRNLTHVNAAGEMHMVDVGDKPATRRIAIAEARVKMGAAARRLAAHSNPVRVAAKRRDIIAHPFKCRHLVTQGIVARTRVSFIQMSQLKITTLAEAVIDADTDNIAILGK